MNPLPHARPLYDSLARGWNTWDVRSVSTHVYLPEGLGVAIGFVIPSITRSWNELAWDEVAHFGEHAADGSFTEVTVLIQGSRFRITSASENEVLVVKVDPIPPVTEAIFVTAEICLLWGARGSTRYEEDTIRAAVGARTFVIDTPSEVTPLSWDPCRGPHLSAQGDVPLYLRVNSRKQPGEMDRFIETKKRAWCNSTIHSEGDFEVALSAMRRSLLWNTIFEPRNRRVLSPVSRNWCRPGSHFGDYVLFGWDTFFAALMFGLISKDLAYANFFAMLEEVADDGMVPNYGSGGGCSSDRSEPPVGARCAWKLYLQYRDQWFIEQVFDRLLAWNRWRFNHRDFNNDGLLELASTPGLNDHAHNPQLNYAVGEKQGAMYESGLDNSPMWDDAIFNTTHHCMELSCVGLNALMVSDCECLAKMASLLGRQAEKTELDNRGQRLAGAINRELWCEERGTYLNKDWRGRFSDRLSPTHFYPLTAGIASRDQASRMIKEHLLNPREFFGTCMIPTTSRDDPAFGDQEYWRGRIWAPSNFLVVEGLKRAGFRDIASTVARAGFELFLRCWKEQDVVGENYNAITGEAAEGKTASDRFYHWGALMVYMAIQEMVDFQPWDDTLHRADPPPWAARLRNVPTREGYLQ